ncbi:hypothetical protein V2J09_009361 [Rumex salicifolius]
MNKLTNTYFICVALLLVPISVFSQSIVDSLPGFTGNLPFKLETGYISVGDLDEIQLFYYFIESEREPKRDPLVFWLNEGLGCAGFSALLYDIGPLSFNYSDFRGNQPTLGLNDYSWTKVANVLFIDFPVGTGFSYSTTPEGYASSDTLATIHAYKFIRKWLLNHPGFLKNQLYLGGNSYAGITVPLLAEIIMQGIDQYVDPKINLKGYILGNPYISEESAVSSRFPYAQRVTLISDGIYESVEKSCNGEFINVSPNNTDCLVALRGVEDCLMFLYMPQILEPTCTDPQQKWNIRKWEQNTHQETTTNLIRLPSKARELWCRADYYGLSNLYMNNPATQEALHVRPGTVNEWVRCNLSLSHTKDVLDTFDIQKSFINSTFRVLIYSGDQDLVVPYLGTEWWIMDLGLSVTGPWRPWFVDGQVAGYTEKFDHVPYRLTFATVKGAGHTAAEYKPKETLSMVNKWFAYYPL